jgi:hypothetical protein
MKQILLISFGHTVRKGFWQPVVMTHEPAQQLSPFTYEVA